MKERGEGGRRGREGGREGGEVGGREEKREGGTEGGEEIIFLFSCSSLWINSSRNYQTNPSFYG